MVEIPNHPGTIARFSVLALTVLMSGCLTRANTPSLPYVQPATSVPSFDAASVQLTSRLQDMDIELQRIRDQIERMQSSNVDPAVIKSLQERVSVIEKQIGLQTGVVLPDGRHESSGRRSDINPQDAYPSRMEKDSGQPRSISAQNSSQDVLKESLRPEDRVYREAYSLYKSGAYDDAFKGFESFLQNYPKSEFSADAVYWMGEVRFAQSRFDEAVLQFDRVVKDFPGSKRELSSLLKQAQSFEKMGDTRSARIILERIVGDHPHSAQAKIAASRLKVLPRDKSD